MTTIVARDGRVVSDRQVTQGSMKYKVSGKIVEVGAPDGSRCIVGFAGSMLDGAKFLSWWRKNWHKEDLRDEIPDGDYEALVLYSTGDISLVNQGVEMFIDEPFFAIGSGKEFAMGALAMGATLEQAVRIAARYDNLTGYDMYTLEI